MGICRMDDWSGYSTEASAAVCRTWSSGPLRHSSRTSSQRVGAPVRRKSGLPPGPGRFPALLGWLQQGLLPCKSCLDKALTCLVTAPEGL